MIILSFSNFLFAQELITGIIKEPGAMMYNFAGGIVFDNTVEPYLKVGDTVKAYVDSTGLKFIYLDKYGNIELKFIHFSEQDSIKINNELDKLMKDLSVKSVILKEKRLKRLTKEYGKRYAKYIFDGIICLGMSKKMVIEAKGEPDKVNRSVGSWGVHEQWVYNEMYLYFENNKLKSWQD
jgi:hypothetical protein